jgi:serine phosphatase RsbU (regulator of sigma subunit)
MSNSKPTDQQGSAAKTDGKAAKAKKKFSYRPGIRMILSIICLLGILGAASFSVYQAMKTLYESNLRDAWTILFLDMETQSQRISEKMPTLLRRVTSRPPVATFSVLDAKKVAWVSGKYQQVKTFEGLGVDFSVFVAATDISAVISDIDGDVIMITRDFLDGKVSALKVYSVNASDIKGMFSLKSENTIVYVANRSGKLIYNNSEQVTPATLMTRPLVQSFIKVPFKQGQAEFVVEKESFYGFYQEVNKTNLILFAEKSKRTALFPIYATINKVGKISVLALVLTLILLQIPLWFATRPIRILTDVATSLAKGDFNVKIPKVGFGELGVLTSTFANMTENLVKRDREIAVLNVEKLEKMKMEQGIKMASTIQERFLFKPQSKEAHDFDIATVYEPSLQLAGDWYGVHFDEERAETIMAIVDITGHGIESSMMTPVISVVFQEQLFRTDQAIDMEGFLKRCNSALFGYGAGKSTATGIIAKWNKVDRKLTWLNAGHPQPVAINADGSMVKSKSTSANGNILGISETLEVGEQSIQLESGGLIAFFSDGLMTATSASGKGFSRKHLYEALKGARKKKAAQALEHVLGVWRQKNQGVTVEDDVCLVLGVLK